ncbi:EF-hand and coiled-coil domain-containing protein 1-like isoform X3 [Chiloscyllium plagiosum]|uniref:EF-hand and coiled-coil domain-containing protein 1-like isoform X3 n=1 Tax=Chiloscyllium plagiosum TaxID=36176 RepID=UPI001CB84D4C|nr:EF-hand and coiled-coil domain-containing protein 1-like isoform X3 [Chiloscyllium plagiosum]
MLGSSDSGPGRRTSWLVSALSHHFGPEGGQVDNEIVVLATGLDQYLQEIFHHLDYEGDGLVSGEDFRALCFVLGLEDGVEGPPEAVTFRHFHALLCEPFHGLLGRGEPGLRLPVSKETEHIERQIQLRCPRRRRRKRSVSFQLPREGGAEEEEEESPGAQQDPSARELENASLRELVEDLRGALQSSDARCLALEVGLHKAITGLPGAPRHQRRQLQEPRPPGLSCPGSRHLLRELELIRSSRDGQLDEARRLNRQLEQELRDAHCRLGHREHRLAALRAEHGRLRAQAERVTSALRAALSNVKELERRVRQLPLLESRLQELEDQLQLDSSTLQRLLSHNCSCGIMVISPWMEREKELMTQLKNKEEQVTELQTETEKLTCAMTKELQLKGEEVEMLRMELQMVETDRVRLSLIEEKLTDVLQLLQQLRTLNISRRSLGKILMSTLDSCYNVGHGMMSSLDILSVLHKELLSCELLSKGSCQTEEEQIRKNSLVISC